MRMTLPGRDVAWKDVIQRLRRELRKDKLGMVAGSVTFATLLSLFPFLIFLVSLAGMLTDPATISALLDELRNLVPAEGLKLIEEYLKGLLAASGGGLLTFGAVGAMWAAGRGVRAFIHALNVAYNCPEWRPAWKLYLLSTATVLVSSVGLVLLMLLVVALPAIAASVRLPILPVLVWLRLPIAGLLLLLVWAVFDRVLPARRRPYRPFTLGNLLGIGGWLVASWGFSVYVRNFGNFNVTYGALGGVIILLLWMNLSVQCFLLAAEVNGVLDELEREASTPGSEVDPAGRALEAEVAAMVEGHPPGRAGASTSSSSQRTSSQSHEGPPHGRGSAQAGEPEGKARSVAGWGAAILLLVRQRRAARAREGG